MKKGDVISGFAVGFIFCIGVIFILTTAFGLKIESVWHDRIIAHSCGQYNPTSGDFEWTTEETK